MRKIAYVANSFPEAAEWYVYEEIRELRRRGRRVIACSFRRPQNFPPEFAEIASETLYVRLFRPDGMIGPLALFFKLPRIADLIWRAIRGPEPLSKRARTLMHTVLGISLAGRLRRENIEHIHVHHGYFAAWAGMIAARLLGASFSLTLHGSDLLVRADYLDCKLKSSTFCITVSEFNREYIRRHYPSINSQNVLVHRLGIDLLRCQARDREHGKRGNQFSVLSVGRLHSVKNHEFLIRACQQLQTSGVDFKCVIAGEGPERESLQQLIARVELDGKVELRGYVPREQLPELYGQCDVVVFTSRSEGIPLAAMEAMAMGKIVLAAAVTGVPELIEDGVNGFLYQPNSMKELVSQLIRIRSESLELEPVRQAARRQVELNFNLEKTLQQFADDFLSHVDSAPERRRLANADPLLQQI